MCIHDDDDNRVHRICNIMLCTGNEQVTNPIWYVEIISIYDTSIFPSIYIASYSYKYLKNSINRYKRYTYMYMDMLEK